MLHAYTRLYEHLESYTNMLVIQYDIKAAVIFDQLQSKKLRIGTMDLRIAAIALAHHALLISRNLRDFRRVPDLQVEDWASHM